MHCELRKLSTNDRMDIYEMLQEVPKEENGAFNPIYGRSFEEFQQWLIRSEALSKATELIDGWKVPTTVYWLYADGYPVGFGKLRHCLTDKLVEEGGNAGYAIRPCQRNRGFGTILLKLLIDEARKMNINALLLTIQNANTPSIKVALKNNGQIEKVTDERHYIRIDLGC